MAKAKWKIVQTNDKNSRYIVYQKSLIRWLFMDWFSTKKEAEQYIQNREDPSYYDKKGNLIK